MTIDKYIKNNDIITNFSYDPLYSRLVITSKNGTIKLYDYNSNVCIKEFLITILNVSHITFHKNGRLLAISTFDYFMCLFSIPECHLISKFRISYVSSSLSFNEQILFCGMINGDIRSFNLDTKKVKNLKNHFSSVTNFSFSPNNLYMCSCSRDKVITLWDLKTYKVKETYLIYESIEDMFVIYHESTFLPEYIYICGDSGILKIYNVKNKIFIKNNSIKLSEVSSVSKIIPIKNLTSESNNFLIKTEENNFFLVKSIKLKLSINKIIFGNLNEILDICSVPKLSLFVIISSNSPNLKILNYKNWQNKILFAHKNIILSLSISSDHKFVITGSKDTTICIWDLYKEKMLINKNSHEESVTSVCFSPKKCKEGYFIVSGSDKVIKLWVFNDNLIQLDLLISRFAHEGVVNTIDVSYNGMLIATGSTDKTVKIWELKKLAEKSVIKGHKKSIWKVIFSPKEKLVASCSSDKTIKLWSLKDFSCYKTFEGHSGSVLGIKFLLNKDIIVSYGADGNIKFWKTRSSSENSLSNYSVVTNEINEKIWGFSEIDDKNFAIGGSSSTISIYSHVKINKEAQKIKSRITNLEKYNYLKSKNMMTEAFSFGLSIGTSKFTKNLFYDMQDLLISSKKSIIKDKSITKNMLKSILKFVTDWTTTSAHSNLSQIVLNWIFKNFDINDISECVSEEDLNTLQFYVSKKYQRVERLRKNSFILKLFE